MTLSTDKFVKNLAALHDGNLDSVVLYGSSAAGDYQKSHSDTNIVVVLKTLSMEELDRASKVVRKWMASGNPPPLFIDEAHIRTSQDVFPMEFLDIRESHRVLYGRDPFADLDVATENLRLQCETELKGKLIGLRTAYLRAAGSRRSLRRIMLESVSGFFAIFRGILRLKGIRPPPKKSETLGLLRGEISFDINILSDLLAVREGSRKLPLSEVSEWMRRYLTSVEAVTQYVDTL